MRSADSGDLWWKNAVFYCADIETFYRWWAGSERVVSCYSQGVNQSTQGSDKVNAIINCHLATGRIGKRGAGPFSVTGQPNAMGGREVGGFANTLAAHIDNHQQVENDEQGTAVWRCDGLTAPWSRLWPALKHYY